MASEYELIQQQKRDKVANHVHKLRESFAAEFKDFLKPERIEEAVKSAIRDSQNAYIKESLSHLDTEGLMIALEVLEIGKNISKPKGAAGKKVGAKGRRRS